MQDPHIDSLTYGVASIGQHMAYSDAAEPLTAVVPDIGRFRIVDNELTVTLAVHCPEERSARDLVDPFLRTWEIQSDLTSGYGAVRFGFRSAAWHDLNPSDGTASFGFSENLVISDSVEFHVILTKYPEPPAGPVAAPDDLVRDIHARWCQYEEDREPLRGMASYVLTRIVLESASDTEPKPNYQTAARAFDISKRVLDAISTAAALPGVGLAARKAYGPAQIKFIPDAAGPDETESIHHRVDAWLEDAIKKVIMHLACRDSVSPRKQLTMNDLLQLPAKPTERSLPGS